MEKKGISWKPLSTSKQSSIGFDIFGNNLREKVHQTFKKTFSGKWMSDPKMYKKGDADSSATVYEDALLPESVIQASPSNERVSSYSKGSHARLESTHEFDVTAIKNKGRKHIGDWELGKTIGEGSSGKVKIARNRLTDEVRVVKAVRRPKLSNGQTASEAHVSQMDPEGLAKIYKRELYMIREATLGIMLRHPNLVKLYSAILGENHFYCFFEFVEGEDLVDYITRYGAIPESRAKGIFQYTHRNHVVHRDIKLENVRYNEKTGIAKVLDFGFATFYRNEFLETNCGSPCYAAPEIYDNKPYIGTASDVWSLGVCLFGMLTGMLPFDGNDFRTLAAKVRAGKVSYPAFLTDEAVHLISKMLKTNPRQRASLYQVIEHPWVNKGYKSFPVDYLENPDISKTPTVTDEFVENMFKSNICEAGCLLMNELKIRMPSLQKEEHKEEDRSSTESDQDGNMQDLDIRMVDKGKVWWRRLMKNISNLHTRVKSQIMEMDSSNSQTPILTRLFHRRVATASAFQTQRLDITQVSPIELKSQPSQSNQQTRIRTETESNSLPPSKLKRWVPRTRLFARS